MLCWRRRVHKAVNYALYACAKARCEKAICMCDVRVSHKVARADVAQASCVSSTTASCANAHKLSDEGMLHKCELRQSTQAMQNKMLCNTNM